VLSNQPTGDVTVGDMERLTVLDASRQAPGPEAPLIQSLEGLQAARHLTQLNLSAGAAGSPNVAVGDFSPLAERGSLTDLRLADNGLTDLILPEGPTSRRYLNVLGDPIAYSAVPKSRDLNQLVIEGFPIGRVTILLRIGPAMVEADGKIRLPIEGACGQPVKVQRSENLVEWEDWQTMSLGGDGCGIIDDPGATRQRFCHAAEASFTPMTVP
jgi:hypothetical protein